MSNNEPLEPVNQESLASELMKSDQNDNTKNEPIENAAPPAEQNADKQCAESTTPSNTNDQTIEAAAKGAEISSENSKAILEAANEATEDATVKVVTSETSEVQQLVMRTEFKTLSILPTFS